jgi:heterodisulfide reductase subunit A-like polyferredoxin
VVIIGGGIAGLTATILPSRMEKYVTAMERSSELGGRVRASLVWLLSKPRFTGNVLCGFRRPDFKEVGQ